MITDKISKTYNYAENTYKYQISIIVPCYNTAPWLDECLQSLVDQTLKQIEIICFNDGSTDGTGSRLDEWQAQHPNKIKVIHQANGGLSNARNAGMAIAQGECIGFVDSDDFVDITMYEKLYQVYKDKNAYVVKCNYIEFTKKENIIINNTKDIIIEKSDMAYASVTACNGLFSKIFLDENKIKFCPDMLYEDSAFHYELLFYSPEFYKINMPLYFYRKQRLGQITSARGKECYDIFKVFSYIENKFKNNDNLELHKFLCRQRIGSIFYVYKKIDKKYKKNFLFFGAKALFSQNSFIYIYKKIMFHRYHHVKNHFLAVLALVFLYSLYLWQKLYFIKTKNT